MKFYTAHYEDFNRISQSCLCIGMTLNIPENFRTTKIDNFLYCPDNLMAADEIEIEEFEKGKISFQQFASDYYKKLENSIHKLNCNSFSEYFNKLDKTFSESEIYDSACFLTDEKTDQICNINFLFSKLADKFGIYISDYFSRAKPSNRQSSNSKQNNVQESLF